MASKALYPAVAIVGIAVLSGAAWWYQNKPTAPSDRAGGGQGGAAQSQPPAGRASGAGGGGQPSVEVARVEVMRLVDETQAVGSLQSRRGVIVRPEVSGRVTALNFRDGERVRKGQVLVRLDDQLQQAQVQQAQAELSIARANHTRNQELVAQNFISQRSVEESAANLQVAQAKLSLARATANRLQIVAPFDGIAGIRLVSVGDYLKDGADIVNIEDLEAVFVDYRLPEQFQNKLQPGQAATVTIDALPGRSFSAVVQAIDPLIDANGRSVGVRGCMDNRRLELRPGMFARVNTVFSAREGARVVPEEALVPQGGRQFVIKLVDSPDGKGKVTQRVEVSLGLRQPGKVEITQGLEAGDTVVIAGQQRVTRDGTQVRVMDMAARNGANSGSGNGSGNRSGQGAGQAAGAGGGGERPAAAPAAVAAMAEPTLAGSNPCLISAARSGLKAAPAASPPASPASPAPGAQQRTAPASVNPAMNQVRSAPGAA